MNLNFEQGKNVLVFTIFFFLILDETKNILGFYMISIFTIILENNILGQKVIYRIDDEN